MLFRSIPRQATAGSFYLLAHLLQKAELDLGSLKMIEPPARNESDVALAVAEDRADAGLAVEAVCRQMRLAFVPLVEERYDIAVWRRDFFEAPMQRLLEFARSAAFKEKAKALGGYDVSNLGTIHLNGP